MANFFLFGLYFGENKAHFFLEHGETKSIALPVHSYYFSKAPARRRKGRKRRREEGTCVCRRHSTREDTRRIDETLFTGKRRL